MMYLKTCPFQWHVNLWPWDNNDLDLVIINKFNIGKNSEGLEIRFAFHQWSWVYFFVPMVESDILLALWSGFLLLSSDISPRYVNEPSAREPHFYSTITCSFPLHSLSVIYVLWGFISPESSIFCFFIFVDF